MRSIAFLLTLLLSTTLADVTDFNYWQNGEDWDGICATGTSQSPINIDTSKVKRAGYDDLPVAIMNMGVISKIKVFATGAYIEAEIEEFSVEPDIRVPFSLSMLEGKNKGKPNFYEPNIIESNFYVKVTPLQYHAHTNSENTVDGKYSAAEVHIVTTVDRGQIEECDEVDCNVVIGLLLSYIDGIDASNDLIKILLDNVPDTAGSEYKLEVDVCIDMNKYLPVDKHYFTWDGSLTTPSCTEGVLWVLFEENLSISMEQITDYQIVISTLPGADCDDIVNDECYPKRSKMDNRAVQPLNDREIVYNKFDLKM